MRLITDAMLAMPHFSILLIPYSFYARRWCKSGVGLRAVVLTHWPWPGALILRADAERVAQSDHSDMTLSSGVWTILLLAISLFSGAIAAMVDGNVIDVSSCGIAQARRCFLGFSWRRMSLRWGCCWRMRYEFISHGNWWLVLFPAYVIHTLVMLFDQFARAIQRLWLRSDVC